MIFTDTEWLRYTRHVQLPQLGAEGQIRLKQAKVLIVGAGGLGSPVAYYLAAAGVGSITIIDGDTVDVTNLQRQILFSESVVGHSKAATAKKRLAELNSSISITAITEHFSVTNAAQLIEKVDLVLDCTDNFATRYLINDVCVSLKKPWVFASIFQFSGQCALFTPESACFRCLFPEIPEGVADCNDAGVLGVLPGLLGTLQANEALKYLAGLSATLENTLLMVEALSIDFKKIKLAKNPECLCGHSLSINEGNKDYQWSCDSEIASPDSVFVNRLLSKESTAKYTLLDVRSEQEHNAYNIGGENIPLDQLENHLNNLNTDKIIICYCQTGIRSEKAKNLLRKKGINAHNLEGGLMSYLKQPKN